MGLKKGEEYTGIVERVDFPNKGIVVCEEGKCTVKNVLEGQKITFRVQKNRHQKAEGRLIEVLEKAPNEIQAPCPHFGSCGGCTYLGLSYEDELKLKEEQVKRLLAPFLQGSMNTRMELCKPDVRPIFEGIKASPKPFEYRNKMEFTFGDEYKDGPLSLGMHKQGGFYDIVTVDRCQIMDEDFRRILKMTKESLKGISFFHRLRHEGFLRHLLVRKALKTGEILVALVTSTQENHDVEISAWKDALLELPLTNGKICGVLHILNDSLADVVKSDETRILYGKDSITEEILGLRFQISTFSFFQTNTFSAEVLYETAREYAMELNKILENSSEYRSDNRAENSEQSKLPVIFDLYSGTGTIAQLMAPVAQKVIGVEIIEEAVEAAKQNAEENGLHNCEFIAGDVLKVLDEIEEKPDLIILDPPRDGIHPKALTKILNYDIPGMVYISCKPTSLARDLEIFYERGYRIQKVSCVDQFPWTGNIETVCLLSKLHEAKHHVNVRLDMDEMDLTAAESKATYEEIKKYVSEHNDGMKVSNLYIAQVKRKCGLELAENFNLPKSEDSRQPQCPKEKEEAIMEALKAFQMI